jgi:hypothetical protein
MSAVEDEETQRQGFICVAYNLTEGQTFNPQLSGGLGKIALCLPFKILGVHVCVGDLKGHKIASLMISGVSALLAVRFKLHCGSHLECIYSVSPYLQYSLNRSKIKYILTFSIA